MVTWDQYKKECEQIIGYKFVVIEFLSISMIFVGKFDSGGLC